MDINYRDYGGINGNVHQPVLCEDQYTQVFRATHGLKEDGTYSRLPYMERSFISFSYGGKLIEDFGLIVADDQAFMQRPIYGAFEDNITESNYFDGQIYWSSHFSAREIEFTLSTDGITERQLGAFKHWFKPGIIRELIVSQHPNRAILARVSQPPEYEVIPFDKQTTITIAGEQYATKTTLYKGSITLKMVADDPFWYSLRNTIEVLDNTGSYNNQWVNANGEREDYRAPVAKDARKIMLEDGIPSITMIKNDDGVDSIGENTRIIRLDGDTEDGSKVGSAVVGQAHVYPAYEPAPDKQGFYISPKYPAYFYYCGTAPGKPTIHFQFPMNIDDDTKYIKPETGYYTLTVQSINKSQLYFTLPSFLAAYNDAIKIFRGFRAGDSIEEVRAAFRDQIKHRQIRRLAIELLNKLGRDVLEDVDFESVIDELTSEIKKYRVFVFIDCKTGHVSLQVMKQKQDNDSQQSAQNTSSQEMILEEDGTDMILSNYISFDDRNYFSQDGYVKRWTEQHPEYSYKVSCDTELQYFDMNYQYLYL